jgi:hypothetical protein
MAKIDLAKVRATMVNIMRSRVYGGHGGQDEELLFSSFFDSLSGGPWSPKVLQ